MPREADKEAWQRLLASRNLSPKLVSTWSDLARPNIRLVSTATYDRDETTVGASKLGGLPDLSVGDAWPTRPAYAYPRGKRAWLQDSAWEPGPLSFLAQINLADIARHGCDLPLPDSGLLLFFYDADVQPGGSDPYDSPGARVLFVSAETPIRRCSSPPVQTSRVRPVQCVPSECLPSWESVEERMGEPGYSHNRDKLSEEDLELITYSGHVFGGWPAPMQGPMELQCALVTRGPYAGSPRIGKLRKSAEEWRLLLRLDSDDEWMWGGDCGRLYFWCHEGDIAARRFERCWAILQYC